MQLDSVLVANRGEIAVRILRTLRLMGLRSVAVYSDADADARHVHEADVAVRLGPATASESYLHVGRVVEAAVASGADAVHPGYGFLSENPELARACREAGLVFVGPPPDAIEAMGDKIRAKELVAAAGVPVVPGFHEGDPDGTDLVQAARDIGFPLLIKPSAGGGGKGMRAVASESELGDAIEQARREARGAFGDDTLLLERLVEDPRHIEVQVIADAHGNVVHLGERECSLQRRHQKIVEEAPSALLTPGIREAMGARAVDAARACGYVNAGTVEYIVPGGDPGTFFFLEMNTRLQVEHPVTELVHGLDLVELQLRIAAGESLPFEQADVQARGHAVEARVYAEDAGQGFLPTGGRVLELEEPELPGVRVDSGLRRGTVVGSDYDPLLAKVVAWAPGRRSALRRLDAALARTSVLGVTTNLAFLRALLRDDAVVAGELDTGLVDRRVDDLVATAVPSEVVVAAVLDRLLVLDEEPPGRSRGPWDRPGGWRIGERAAVEWHVEVPGCGETVVEVVGPASAARVDPGGEGPIRASARRDGAALVVTCAERTRRYTRHLDAGTGRVWLGRDGAAWALTVRRPLERARRSRSAVGGRLLASPMPGTVTAVAVTEGETVALGQVLVVIEAMKMEHNVIAETAGVVAGVFVGPGEQVTADQSLISIEEE